MRLFNSRINLKAAADSFVLVVFVDVTLTELVSAHSIARPLLALQFRLKKWCDLVNGFGAECAWSISFPCCAMKKKYLRILFLLRFKIDLPIASLFIVSPHS